MVDNLLFDEAALYDPVPLSSFRVVYGTFFCAQAAIFMGRLFRSLVLPGTSFFDWSASTELLSLGTLIFMSRHISVDSGMGLRLVFVFLIHNFACLTMTLHTLIYSVVQMGFDRSDRLYDMVMVLMYLFWIITGTLSLRRERRIDRI